MAKPIEAIEARIRENRDDTEAWKIYADALLDQGDPRGELIMLELQPGALRDPVLRSRITTLKQHEDRAGWEPAALTYAHGTHDWRHGFVVGVTVDSIIGEPGFRAIRRLLIDPQARLLGRLKLVFGRTRGAKYFDPLAELDLGKLCWLEVSGFPEYSGFSKGDQLVRALVRQPTLNLRGLDLHRSRLTDAGLTDLVDCPRLRSLRKLDLSNNEFAAEGIHALANAPSLSELEELDLRYTGIDIAGASALAASPFLRRLTDLRLDVDEDGARALSSSFEPTSPFSWRAR